MTEILGHYGGMDLAQTRDYTALAIGALTEEEDGITVKIQPNPEDEARVVSIRNRLRLKRLKVWPHLSYTIIEGDVEPEIQKWGQPNFLELGVDATNERSFSQRLQAMGIPVRPLTFTAPLKHEMVTDLRFFLHNKIFVLPQAVRDSQLLTELKEQELISRSGASSPRYGHPSGRHDDRFWACAMLCHMAKPRLLGMLDLGVYRI